MACCHDISPCRGFLTETTSCYLLPLHERQKEDRKKLAKAHWFETIAITKTQGGTQHIHIQGGKSDIFGSEYCEK